MVLKHHFPELQNHLSPYAPEDKTFYKRSGFPKPIPDFPTPFNPLYYYRRWERGGENFILKIPISREYV